MQNASFGLVVAVGAASAAGYAVAGPAFGFVGVGVGALAGAVLTLTSRFSRHRGAFEEAAIELAPELSPHQRLAVLATTAASKNMDRPSLSSPLLDELAEIEQLNDDDPEAARNRCQALARKRPTSPAVAVTQARLAVKADDRDQAIECATRAVRLAIRGGANPLAANILEEFSEIAPHFNLSRSEFEHLSRVFASRGHDAGAEWCLERTQSAAA